MVLHNTSDCLDQFEKAISMKISNLQLTPQKERQSKNRMCSYEKVDVTSVLELAVNLLHDTSCHEELCCKKRL